MITNGKYDHIDSMTNGHSNQNIETNGTTNGHHHPDNYCNGNATNGKMNLEETPTVPRYEELIGNEIYCTFFRTCTARLCNNSVLTGKTPMVDITSLANPKVPGIRVLAKCEFLNPGFSMKDRIIKNIFDKAEQDGRLKKGGTVVSASSGNTGAAVAMMAAMRGYKAVITTSPKCSQEKMDTIRAYGATLMVSPPGTCLFTIVLHSDV